MSIIDLPTSCPDRSRATARFSRNAHGAQLALSPCNSPLPPAVTRPAGPAHRQRVRMDIPRKQNGNSVQRHFYLWWGELSAIPPLERWMG